MKNVFVLFMLLSFSTYVVGQNAQISGQILSDAGEPISYATVQLKSKVDSTLVKAAITELEGDFAIQTLAGNYFLEVSYIGYQTLFSEPIQIEEGESYQMGEMKIMEAAEDLEEVVVKAARPLVEVQPDRTVFNVDGSINANGSDALELLRKAPGVVVDNNESIILQGKNGVQVYIDDKPSPLSADDLASFLKTMQSSEIDAIEIITNPSAKYDAEGNAGIINIRLKKDKSLGTNGSLTTSFRQGVTPKTNNSISLNHRNKEINIFGRYGNNFGHYRNTNNILREQLGMGFDSHSGQVSENNGHNFRVGADLFVSDKSTVGVLVNGAVNDNVFYSAGKTRIYPLSSGMTNQILDAENTIDQTRDNLNANLNYVFNNNKGSRLNIDADFGMWRNTGASYQPNFYRDASETQIIETRIFSNNTPTDIDIYTLKADYEANLGSGKISFGAKSSIVRTDNTFDFFDIVDDIPVKNLDRSNNFIYKENVNAGYVSYQTQKGKWNLMGGLRLEHTHSLGELSAEKIVHDEKVERDYVNLFPSAGITWQANDNNSWRINYSRRIDRPSYQDLNPFEFKLDELTFQKGNAFLNPQYTNSISLSHTYKYRLNTTLSYSVTDDLITEITDTFSADASFITYVNLAKQKNVSLTVSYPFSVTKWWNVYANATAYHVSNKAQFEVGKTIDLSANVFTFYGQNTFLLPKGYKFEISGFYNSPGLWGGNFKTESMYGIDLGLQKKIFNEKADLKLAVTDVFKTQGWTGSNELGALRVIASGGWESRQFRATLSYNFGSNEVKAARRRSTGIESESSRVKSD